MAVRHPGLRPEGFPPLSDFEVRYVFYPDKRELNRMLSEFARVFRNGGISMCDLDMDIGRPVNGHRRRNGSECDVGTYVPTTERVTVAVSCTESCLLRQMKMPCGAPRLSNVEAFHNRRICRPMVIGQYRIILEITPAARLET